MAPSSSQWSPTINEEPFPTAMTERSSTDDDSIDAVEAQKILATNQETEDLLQHTIQDIGNSSRGAVMTELWVFEGTSTATLTRKAHWMDPHYKRVHCTCQPSNVCSICVLTDPSQAQHVPAAPVSIGEGLPGILWASSCCSMSWGHHRRETNSLSLSRHSQTSLGTTTSALSATTRSTLQHLLPPMPVPSVTWRHLRSMAADPDQTWNPRLAAAGQLPAVEWVSGIPFAFGYQQRGLLIVLASQGESLSTLCSSTNQDLLYMSAQRIGSLYCWRQLQAQQEGMTVGGALGAVTDIDQQRSSHHRQQLQLLEEAILEEEEGGGGTELKLADDDDFSEKGPSSFCCLFFDDILGRVQTVATKSKGAGNKPPPPMSTIESFVTFVGVFWTLLLLTLLNGVIRDKLGREYEIVLGYVQTVVYHFRDLIQCFFLSPPQTIWSLRHSVVRTDFSSRCSTQECYSRSNHLVDHCYYSQ